MSDNKVEDDLELEEGEIAEDSNDGCSLTNDDDGDVARLNDFDQQAKGESSNNNNTADLIGSNLADDNGANGPQKKRKKVVRKVRRKIKVKKKVVRKKGVTNNDNNNSMITASSIQPTLSSSTLSSNQSLLGQTPLLPHIAQQKQQQHHHQQQQKQSLDSTNLLQNQQQQQQLINPLQQQHTTIQQPLLPQTQNNQPLDSLWEQQILMLQELQRQQQVADQKHAQILRAAATDEDLRIFPINNTNSLLLNHQQLQIKPHANLLGITANQQPQQILQQQHHHHHQANQPLQQQTVTQILTRHQTPSSPDDENGKSSYEAISKMLTLLRNSASLNDSSENSNSDNQTSVDQMRKVLEADVEHDEDHRMATGTANNRSSDDKVNKNQVEYLLVPILVEGIDYTKYKLLSQYEPKFKNDPRLNPMT